MTIKHKAEKFVCGAVVVFFVVLLWLLPWSAVAGNHPWVTQLPDSTYDMFATDTMLRKVAYFDTVVIGTLTSFPTNDTVQIDSSSVAILSYDISHAGWDGYELYVSTPIFPLLVSATATVDLEAIADTVENILSAIHGTGAWTSSASGTGDFDRVFIAWDAVTGGAIEGVSVTVWDTLQSVKKAVGRTNANGLCSTSIGTDTQTKFFHTVMTSPGYQWTSRSVTVAGPTSFPDTVYGYQNNPTAAPSVEYVTVFLNVGSGVVDSASGAMLPRDRAEITLTLVGEPRLNDGSWSYIPKVQKKKPDVDGQVQFQVPANTALSPAGSYYVLTYEVRDRRSSSTGEIRRFVVDTLTDPINILDCEEAQ